MAGGTWIDQNKLRPGVYINYKSSPSSLATMGERGVVAIARPLNWGQKGKLYTVESPEDTEQFGYPITADEMLFLRQILAGSSRTQGATKVLVWSLEEEQGTAVKASGSIGDLTFEAVTAGSQGNLISVSVAGSGAPFTVTTNYDGVKVDSQTASAISDLTANDYVVFSGTGSLSAGTDTLSGGKSTVGTASVTVGNLTATANYPGSYGNRLSIVITAGATSNYIVQTLLDGQLVDTQDVTAISGLVPNPYITFSGAGAITTSTGAPLTGGADGDPLDTSYSDFRTAISLQKFDVVIYDGTDAVMKKAFADFAIDLSNKEGIKCQAVLSDYNSANNECVISVYPQKVTLIDGTQLKPEQLTWWVGGVSAGANAFESLTFASYPDAIEVDPVLSSSQQEAAISGGQFSLIAQFDNIQVLTDINSFRSYTPTKGKAFSKNRVIRTIFGLCNDIYKAFALYYIGAVHNDEEGRKSLKAEILNLMNRYQGNRALQNVIADDVNVEKGVDSDAVTIEIYCQPVDSIEKIYINITIS
jgi:hypothetical protein